MSLSSRSFAVFSREVLLFGSNLITSLIIARTLGPSISGIWIVLALIPSYAETLFRIKTDIAAIFYLGQGIYELGDVVFMLNLIALVTSAILLIPLLIWFEPFKAAFFGGNVNDIGILIFIMLMQIPINFLYMNYTYLHIHKQSLGSLNAMVITRALVSSILIITMLLVFNAGLLSVVIGSTVGLTCALAVGIFRFGMVPRTRRYFDLNLLKDLLRYGSKLYIGGVISHLNIYFSQAIVVAFCQPAQIAFFSIAQQLGQLINKVTEAMSTFLFPAISKHVVKEDAAKLAARAFRISVVILVPAGLMITLFIHPAILLLYGVAYIPVLVPFYIILPGMVLAACASILMMFFQGTGRADLVAKVAILPLLVQGVTALILVPKWGIVGGASSLLITLLATAIIQIVLFIKTAGLSHKELMICWSDIQLVMKFIGTIIRRPVLVYFQQK